ncbi:MAG: hypothetical protein ABW162_18260 [Candidatus Sedimenticola sp. PURPLELP]
MQRRKFLQLMGGAGLAAGLPGWSTQLLAAGSAKPFEGPYYLNFALSGGMDQSSWGDPRHDPAMNRYPGGANAGKAGRLWYAPMGRNKEIFQKYHKRMLVFNGLRVTVSHSVSGRLQATGRTAQGYPALASLYASCVGEGLPIPWFVSDIGGPNAGLTPHTRIGGKAIKQLGNPNILTADIQHQRPEVVDAVKRYRLERLAAQSQEQGVMPFARNSIDKLHQARLGTDLLDRLADAMPEGDFESPEHQAIVQFAAGVTASATTRVGGWDTHKEHPNATGGCCTRLATAIEQAWKWAEHFGIDDKLVIHISSDTGRTPTLNAGGGKDHGGSSTNTIMMKNQNWTNRVVGITGPRHQILKINPSTLQADTDGVVMNPAHVHRALRQILGIDKHPLARQFSFGEAEIDVLNPSKSSPVRPG